VSVRVLGIGNVLMSDDGFGPYVVRLLEATYECPPDVEFIDVGTPGLDLTPYLFGTDAVIFVDALSCRGNAGEIRVYDREEILRHPPQPRTGGHDPAMKEALLTVQAAGIGPRDVILVGVVPAWIATGVVLSPQVQKSVGLAMLSVVRALKSVGVILTPRAQPRPPDVWWVRPPDGVSVAAGTPRD
jgi:hydrogenase maturation protease